MPYFKWYGLHTPSNTIRSGKLFARNAEHVSRILSHKQQITLITCTQKKAWYSSSPSYAEKALFFNQMSTLLKAGIHTHQALTTTVHTIAHKNFKSAVQDCVDAVEEGVSFSRACQNHACFEPYASQLIAAGEESGTVHESCAELAQRYTLQDEQQKKLRSLLLMPLVTLIFFMVVVCALFFVVIPRFATILQSLNKPLSSTTQAIINISQWLMDPQSGLITILGIASILAGIWMLSHTPLKRWATAVYYHLPFVRSWTHYSSAHYFFTIAGTLLQRGVSIDQALQLATMSVPHLKLQHEYAQCVSAVKSGIPLSTALHNSALALHTHCITLIALGESSGTLGSLLIECARFYQEKSYTLITRITQLVQPLLLIVLGLLIAGLIFTLYEPLFTLTSVAV